MTWQPVPGVAGLTPYQPGKPIDELQRELGLTQVVKLASNENPLGASPHARAAIEAVLADPMGLARYPDGNGHVLKEALHRRFGLDPAGLVLGNGSNDVLDLVARTFLGPGDTAVYSQHAFAVYPLAVQAVGATGIEVPARAGAHDLPAMAAAVTDTTRVLFLANPNNPTGTWFEADAFHRLMAEVPERVVVVLDEAYVEYVTDPEALNGLDELARYPNLVVTRTFAKAYGLAALRVGYAAMAPVLADLLNRVRQPFNVNTLALVSAAAALFDEDFVAASRRVNEQGRQQWLQALAAMGLSALPSRGNFLCVHLGRPGLPVYQALLREGVIVRPVTAYGLPDYLRISIGSAQDNAVAIAALQRVLTA